jgi:hypothetical protein
VSHSDYFLCACGALEDVEGFVRQLAHKTFHILLKGSLASQILIFKKRFRNAPDSILRVLLEVESIISRNVYRND